MLLFFEQIHQGTDPGPGKNRICGDPLFPRTSSSDRKAISTNRIYINYLEACGENCCYFCFHSELKCLTYFVVNWPSPFSEAGSVTQEKCASDEIDRAVTMGNQLPLRRAKLHVSASTTSWPARVISCDVMGAGFPLNVLPLNLCRKSWSTLHLLFQEYAPSWQCVVWIMDKRTYIKID